MLSCTRCGYLYPEQKGNGDGHQVMLGWDKESCKLDVSQPPVPADCQAQGVQLVPFAQKPTQPSSPTLTLYWGWPGGSGRRKRTTNAAPQHTDVSG